MKDNSIFQYVVLGAFIFFIVVGAIVFATYKSGSSTSKTQISITLWGSIPQNIFTPFVANYTRNLLGTDKFVVNYVEKDSSVLDADLVEALASGDGPDAIVLPQNLILRYLNKVYTVPFTTLPERTYLDTYAQISKKYLTSNGVLALPFQVDPLIMYWNRDTFSALGITKPPATWAEIIALTTKVNKIDQNKNILETAVALGEYQNINNAKEILSTMLLQLSNPIVSLDSGVAASTLSGSSLNKTSSAEQVLQYYTSFSNPTQTNYSWNRSLTSSLNAFASGDLAVYFGLASEYTKIRNKNPNLNFDVAMMPQVQDTKIKTTFGNIYGFAILKSAKDPASTYSVISQLSSADAVSSWPETYPFVSARNDVLGLSTANSAVKDVFNKSAIIADTWLDPNSQQTSNIFQEMVESYTTSRATLDGAIGTADSELGALLGNK